MNIHIIEKKRKIQKNAMENIYTSNKQIYMRFLYGLMQNRFLHIMSEF